MTLNNTFGNNDLPSCSEFGVLLIHCLHILTPFHIWEQELFCYQAFELFLPNSSPFH